MTYLEAIQFLYDLRLFGAKMGLENTFKLASLAGNPQDKLRFIHVAGTNGKGSTCAMLEGIYRKAGLRVGLFTSPHLVSFAERIQINRQPISESNVIRLVDEMRQLIERLPSTDHPTFFEVVTVMALRFFVEEKCELVIWETGLGGRLDATNIVTPLASVITNIQYDHQKWLGETLEKIAFEKSGIIKPGVPVLTAADEPAALDVIRQVALERKSLFTLVDPQHPASATVQSIALSLEGAHQRINAALAVATVSTLEAQIPVSEVQIRAGLENVFWPGRLQRFKRRNQTIMLDGAHNPAGIRTLIDALSQEPQRPALIVGALNDKDWPAMASALAPLSDNVFIVPVHSDRTVPPSELVQSFCRGNSSARVTACESLADALAATESERFVVITGSLYLIGEAMELLGLSAARNERGLNEWQPASSKQL